MGVNFDCLVRFVSEKGEIHYGNLQEPRDDAIGSQAEVLAGDPITGFQSTGKTQTIKKVLISFYGMKCCTY